MTPQEFAQQIKSKYPQYRNMDDVELTRKMLAQYPQYRNQVQLVQPASSSANPPAPKKSVASEIWDFVNKPVIPLNQETMGKHLDEALAEPTPFRRFMKALPVSIAQSATNQLTPLNAGLFGLGTLANQFRQILPLMNASIDEQAALAAVAKATGQSDKAREIGANLDALVNQAKRFEGLGSVLKTIEGGVGGAFAAEGVSTMAQGKDWIDKLQGLPQAALGLMGIHGASREYSSPVIEKVSQAKAAIDQVPAPPTTRALPESRVALQLAKHVPYSALHLDPADVHVEIRKIQPQDVEVQPAVEGGQFAVVRARTQLGVLSSVIPDSIFRETAGQVKAGRQLGSLALTVPERLIDYQQPEKATELVKQYLTSSVETAQRAARENPDTFLEHEGGVIRLTRPEAIRSYDRLNQMDTGLNSQINKMRDPISGKARQGQDPVLLSNLLYRQSQIHQQMYDIESAMGTLEDKKILRQQLSTSQKPLPNVYAQTFQQKISPSSPSPFVKSPVQIVNYTESPNRVSQQVMANSASIQSAYEGFKPGDAARMIIREANARQVMMRERAIASLSKAENLFDDRPKAEQFDFINRLERGQSQTTLSDQALAGTLRRMLDERRDIIRSMDPNLFQHYLKNYFPHFWNNPNEARNVLNGLFSRRPLTGPKDFLKSRSFDYFQDGMDAGLDPVTTNPVSATLMRIHTLDKFIAGKTIIHELQKNGFVQQIPDTRNVPNGWMSVTDAVGNRQTYAPKEVAGVLNNFLSRGLYGRNKVFDMARNYGNALNQVNLGLSAYHLMFTSMDAATSKLALGLQKIASGRTLSGLGDIARANIFVAPIENYFRGNKLLQEYYKPGSQGTEIGNMVEALVKAGGRVRMDDFYRPDSATGRFFRAWKNSSGGEKLSLSAQHPLQALSFIMDKIGQPIMNEIVPRQKLGVFSDLARFELSRLGDNSSPAQTKAVLQRAWDSVDNRMGQLVYDNLFWNRIVKDIGMVAFRSLGWNIGTFRELGGGLRDIPLSLVNKEITPKMAYVMALPAMMALHGALYQYLATGKAPESLVDYFYPRNGGKNQDGTDSRVQIASYMKDVVGFAKGFEFGVFPGIKGMATELKNKVHPLVQQVAEMLQNKDWYGTKITDPSSYPEGWQRQTMQIAKDYLEYIGKQFEPIGFKNIEQQRKSGQPLSVQLQSLIGITPALKFASQSPVERYLMNKSFETERAPVSKSEYERRELIKELGAKMAQGQDMSRDIMDFQKQGKLSPMDVKKIIDDSNPMLRQNRLIKNFRQLRSLFDAIEAYRLATPEEQQVLRPLLMQKRSQLQKMNPEERQRAIDKLNQLEVK